MYYTQTLCTDSSYCSYHLATLDNKSYCQRDLLEKSQKWVHKYTGSKIVFRSFTNNMHSVKKI